MTQPTEESFLKDVAKHEMIVLRDDGVYRHIRFQKPGSGDMHFDLVTWPGYLAYSGDMGCYVFSRIEDMFAFFRGNPGGSLRINLGYWHEKVQGQSRHDGVKEYSEERFRANVARWLDYAEASAAIREAVEDEVLSHAGSEHEAYHAVMNFQHDGWHFQDFWEADSTEYTYRYIWCCFALVWGIRHYDAAKRAETVGASHDG